MSFGMIRGINILHFYGNIDKKLLLIIMKYTQNKNKQAKQKAAIVSLSVFPFLLRNTCTGLHTSQLWYSTTNAYIISSVCQQVKTDV